MMAKKRDMRPPTAKAAREILDLIERDREAAAATLGVPLEAARPPMETQDSTPVPRHNGDYPGTFPPPLRDDQATPRQAPPLAAKKAVPVRGEAALRTELTEPIGGARKRWPVIAAAIAGVATIATAAAVMLSGGHQDHKPADPPVAIAAPPVASAAPVATPPVETKPAEPPVPAAGSAEVKPAETGSAEATPVETTPRITARPKHPPRVETKHVATKPPETTHVQTTVATPPVETKAKPIDTGALVAQYKSIGAELKALEQAKGADAASDLQARYRMIRITDAMTTQDKRDAAAKLLSKLHADISARSR
jgi:hypothetical protein